MQNRNRGYLLIELVIVIAILGIILSSGALILKNHLNASIASKNSAEVNAKVSMALTRMSREIREALEANPKYIQDATSSKFTFTSLRGLPISYFILPMSSDLMRNNDILLSGATDITFTYFNANNTTTTNIQNINCVQFTLTVDTKGVNKSFTTMVCPRNFHLTSAIPALTGVNCFPLLYAARELNSRFVLRGRIAILPL